MEGNEIQEWLIEKRLESAENCDCETCKEVVEKAKLREASPSPSDAVEAKEIEPFGYHFNGRFYKTLNDLRGKTMSEDNQPLPLYIEAYATKTYTPPTEEEIEKFLDKTFPQTETHLEVKIKRGVFKNGMMAMLKLSQLPQREEGEVERLIATLKADGHSDAYIEIVRRTPISIQEKVREEADRIVNGWISVEDRLPDFGEEVLCYRGKSGHFLSSLVSIQDRYNEWFVDDEIIQTRRDITHWQSLPEPPKEKKKEEYKFTCIECGTGFNTSHICKPI